MLGRVGDDGRGCYHHDLRSVLWVNPGGQLSTTQLLALFPHKLPVGWGKRKERIKVRKLGSKDKTTTKKIV